jgi:hypothetical protein
MYTYILQSTDVSVHMAEQTLFEGMFEVIEYIREGQMLLGVNWLLYKGSVVTSVLTNSKE